MTVPASSIFIQLVDDISIDVFDYNQLYFQHPQAAMTFEGQKFEGQQAISAKLTGLPFKTVKHVVTTVDVQPIPGQEAYIILVLGQLKTDDDPPHGFSEVFTIFNVNGQHVVVNDVFRLALHNG
eukprot:sb/3475723/